MTTQRRREPRRHVPRARRRAGASGVNLSAAMQPGTAIWFARHESRLAWRDWLSMMTAGRRARRRAASPSASPPSSSSCTRRLFGGRRFRRRAASDKHTLITITATLLLSWLLMISQAMESMTRAFYARSDLDLILASPIAAHKLFAVRISTVALTVAAMALPLAAPFIDILIVRGGARWLGAYALILAMGAAAAALAVALTVALFRLHRPEAHAPRRADRRRGDRRRLRHRPAGRGDHVLRHAVAARHFLQSDAVLARPPDLGSLLWWPARAVLGDGMALAAVLAVVSLLLAAVIVLVAPRFGDYAIAAAGAGNTHAASAAARRRSAKPRRAARCAARNGCCCGATRGWCRRR